MLDVLSWTFGGAAIAILFGIVVWLDPPTVMHQYMKSTLVPGRVRFTGKQRLKDKFGQGYKLVLTTVVGDTTAHTPESVEAWLKKECPDAVLTSSVTHTYRFTVPLSADVARLFEVMSKAADADAVLSAARSGLVLASWSLQQSSLEEVFISIATQFRGEGQDRV